MTLKKAEYILQHYYKLMNQKEQTAWRHWALNYKIQHTQTDQDKKTVRIQRNYENGNLSKDPDILCLLESGIDQFKINTAKRIAKDHPEVLFMNNCPKCGKLARTPFAKQCQHCFHKWH